ncbi:hypothetical protein OFN63_35545, partial [Escherichia coli]|nr:hypothetical protein [Escherichia coli]
LPDLSTLDHQPAEGEDPTLQDETDPIDDDMMHDHEAPAEDEYIKDAATKHEDNVEDVIVQVVDDEPSSPAKKRRKVSNRKACVHCR